MNEHIYEAVSKAYSYNEMVEILEERKKAYEESINTICAALEAMQKMNKDKAYELLADAEPKNVRPLRRPDAKPVGRPRTECSNDMTLDVIRNQMRLGVPAKEIAATLGISLSTFWRRLHNSDYVPGYVNFSALTKCS